MKTRYLVTLLLTITLSGCGDSDAPSYQGYVEGEPIFLTSPYAGILTEAHVHRGQQVKKGDLLFKLDSNPQTFTVKEDKAALMEATLLRLDLQNPKRKQEIAAISSQIEQVEAQLKLAGLRVQRYQKLFEKHVTSKDDLDEVVASFKSLEQLKAQYQSNLELAKEGSRVRQIEAQQAKIVGLTARLNQSKWTLAQKTFYAPADGIIFDTYYRQGEYVNNKPVASLLTPANTRIEFFVPNQVLPHIRVGQTINFTCAGCNPTNEAVISYVSPNVEYAPPVVYSRENNDNLVFRVQADISNPRDFKPGQPVTINGIDHD